MTAYPLSQTPREILEQTIAALEAQRVTLGDLVVETALHPLREQLAALESAAALGAQPGVALRGERKAITVLLADVKGSTDLAEQLPVEEWVEVMNRLFHLLENEIYRLGGEVNQFRGDGLLAFFGATVTHEDDPERAVLAALAMQQAATRYAAALLARRGITLQLRVGIHTGEVIVMQVGDARQHSEDTAMGRTVALAARMESACEPGTVLVTASTYYLVAPRFEWLPVGKLTVKGFSQPVSAYRPLARLPWAGSTRGIPGLYSPLVGRDAERWALHSALARVQAGLGGIVTLVGEAGLGKSRLVTETHSQFAAGELAWVEGRCLSYGAADAFHLWRDVLRSLFALPSGVPCATAREALRGGVAEMCLEGAEEVYACLADLLITPGESDLESEDLVEYSRQRTFAVIETVLRAASQRCPLVIVCEDLHWADPISLALLEHALPLCERYPVLFLCVMRPDVGQPSWRLRALIAERHAARHTDLWLKPLNPLESEALVGNLLRVAILPAELRSHILDRAEGNPFYVEEIVRSLMDTGVIRYDPGLGLWQLTQEPAAVTIPDTLQGVLLARMDRLPAEARRVLQVAAVIGRLFPYSVLAAILPTDFNLDRQLAVLEETGMVRERVREPERELIFKHQLTQEAAYSGLLSAERRALHREVAQAIKALFPDRLWAHAGLLAHHWQAAGEPNRAIPHLVRAGGAAVTRSAHAEAEAYLRRALVLAQETGLMLAEADALSRLAVVSRNQGNYPEAARYLERSLEIYHRFSNRRREATLWAHLGRLNQRRGDFESAQKQLLCALESTRLVHDRHGEPAVLRDLGGVILDQGDLEAAVACFQEALALEQQLQDLPGVSLSLACLANAWRRLGDFSAARQAALESVDLSARVHQPEVEAWVALVSAWLLDELGEASEAHRHARLVLQFAQQRGDRAIEGDARVVLANALFGLGRFSEARVSFEAAAEIRAALGETHLLAEPFAGLLRLALKWGDTAEVAAQRVALREQLERFSMQPGTIRPLASYIALIASLSPEDPDRDVLAHTACELLSTQAARITSAPLRQAYLTHIPVHQIIQQEAQRLVVGDCQSP
ncbi:MAG: Adenylate cyclase 2 [Chloroflexi bacterium ADurb.Bin360]|nr:MAG: Adenylate cyclase 2 [Chloroflexi bacterium ADurb.Bin360]